MQPDYLDKPNAWAAFFEGMTQKLIATKANDDGILQRQVRVHGNFAEYVPLGLLFIVALELMHSETWLVWLLGGTLTIARIAHAWGV